MTADLFDRVPVARDDEVRVLTEDGAGVDDDSRAGGEPSEPARDCPSLQTGELHRVAREVSLRFKALGDVVPVARTRPAVLHFRRGTESAQLPRADEIRPRAPRVIRQPETVGAEDEVVPEDGWEGHERGV
jgi:hypothetical protein